MKFSSAALTLLQLSSANWLPSSASKACVACFLVAPLFDSVSAKDQLSNGGTITNDAPPSSLLRGVNQQESSSLSHNDNFDIDLSDVDVPEKYGEIVEFASHLLSKPVAQLTIKEQKDLLIEAQSFFKDTLLVEFNSAMEELPNLPGLELLAKSLKHVKLDHGEEGFATVIGILQDALAAEEEDEVFSTSDENSLSVTSKKLPRHRRRRTKEFDKYENHGQDDKPPRTSLNDREGVRCTLQNKYGNRAAHLHDRMLSLDSFGTGGSTMDDWLSGSNPAAAISSGYFPRKQNLYQLRRKLMQSNKEEMCSILAECVLGMSMYDMFVYFYSDDINSQNGDIDTNVVRFDEKDLVAKHEKVRELAGSIKQYPNRCDLLLQHFHRTIERGQAAEWQGATVGQVCLAEGTTVFVQVDAMMDAFLIDTDLDKLLIEQEKIAEKLIGETFRCAEELFYLHDDQKDYVRDEEFVFKGCGKDYQGVCPLSNYKFPTSIDASRNIPEEKKTVFIQNHKQDDFWLSVQDSSLVRSGGVISFDESQYKEYGRVFGWTFQRVSVTSSNSCIRYGESYWFGMIEIYTFEKIFFKMDLSTNMIRLKREGSDVVLVSADAPLEGTDPKAGQCIKYHEHFKIRVFHDDKTKYVSEKQWHPVLSASQSQDSSFEFSFSTGIRDNPEKGESFRNEYGQLTGSNGAYNFKEYDDLTDEYEECISSATSQTDLDWQEEHRKCIATRINKPLGKSLQLVFGSNPSPGFICGVRDAVKSGKKLPGYCCLDAPFQLDGSNWGHEYDCNAECKLHGPYFAGISEASCHAQGGTFCPNPADCSTLQDCVNEYKEEAVQSSNTMFKTYLDSAPKISDPTNHEQCGMTRGYFGFDQKFIHDSAICEDIEQLKHSKTFSFAFEFFSDSEGMQKKSDNQGKGVSNDCKSNGNLKTEAPLDDDVKKVEDFSLSAVNRDLSQEPTSRFSYVQDGVFVLQEYSDTLKDVLGSIVAFECPEDITGGVKSSCAGVKNGFFLIAHIIYIFFRMILNISMHILEKYFFPDGGKEFETYENTQAVYGHMVDTGKYMEKGLNLVLSDIALVKKGINSITGPTAQNIVETVDEIMMKNQNETLDALNIVLSEIEKIRETSNQNQLADRHLNMNVLSATSQVTPEHHQSISKDSAPPFKDNIKQINEKITSVDEKMAIMGQEIVASVDERMVTMGHEITASMEEKIASLKDEILKSLLDMKSEN